MKFSIPLPFLRSLLLATLVLLLLNSSTANAQNLAANRRLVMDWLKTLNQHDTNRLVHFYDEQVKLESPNWEGVLTGPAEAKTVYSRYFTSTPDLKNELTNVVLTDTCAVVEYTSSGTLLKNETGVPEYMRGKKYTIKNCTRMDIRNGKIIHQVNYFDQVAFLRQMGFFDHHN
ncbi:MAG: hypothetical protein C5B59_03950 [Bacteroidetes bacterium]|nr:MAG: hypothetical protein C5B59_03950 [Bacteroidota bacterium]